MSISRDWLDGEYIGTQRKMERIDSALKSPHESGTYEEPTPLFWIDLEKELKSDEGMKLHERQMKEPEKEEKLSNVDEIMSMIYELDIDEIEEIQYEIEMML